MKTSLMIVYAWVAIFFDYYYQLTITIGGHGTLQKYRGTGTRYFAKISTTVPVLSN